MSDAIAKGSENINNQAELAVEIRGNSVEDAIKRGDISGVHDIAKITAEDAVSRGKKISDLGSESGLGAIAGPEIIALKRADAELEEKSDKALSELNASFDAMMKETEAPADISLGETASAMTEVHAMVSEKSGLKLEELVEPKVISVEETGDTTLTTLELSDAAQEELEQIDAESTRIHQELASEKNALQEFTSAHGAAYTKLEQRYIDALQSKITALEFEKKTHEVGDTSEKTIAKKNTLKEAAENAEAAYTLMYEEYRNQPKDSEVNAKVGAAEKMVSSPRLQLDTSDEHYEAAQYQRYYESNNRGGSEPSKMPTSSSEGLGAGATPTPKGKFGKFLDTLKFWKYMTGEQQ